MEPCCNGPECWNYIGRAGILKVTKLCISVFCVIIAVPHLWWCKCIRHFSIMFMCLFLQGSLSVAAGIHKEEPGNKWRSFVQGVSILIWGDEKTKYLTIQVPCTCINFKISRFSLSHLNCTEFLTVPTFVGECSIFFLCYFILRRNSGLLCVTLRVHSYLENVPLENKHCPCNSWLFLCGDDYHKRLV
jgi:hypothetical protein